MKGTEEIESFVGAESRQLFALADDHKGLLIGIVWIDILDGFAYKLARDLAHDSVRQLLTGSESRVWF